MFEGNRATITKAENGYITEFNGREYLHPDPTVALAEAAEYLGIKADVTSPEWHEKNKEHIHDLEVQLKNADTSNGSFIPKLQADAVTIAALTEENKQLREMMLNMAERRANPPLNVDIINTALKNIGEHDAKKRPARKRPAAKKPAARKKR